MFLYTNSYILGPWALAFLARAAHRTRCDGYDGRFLRVNTRPVWGLGSCFYGRCSTAVTAVIQVTGLAYNFVPNLWNFGVDRVACEAAASWNIFVKVNQLKILSHLGSQHFKLCAALAQLTSFSQ